MSVIIVLIGFSLIVALVFLVAFLWSVKSGQYEDDYTPSIRILFDDEKPSVQNDSPNSVTSSTKTDKPNNS